MIKEFRIPTPGQTALIDVTSEIRKIIKDSAVKNGICIVFVPHTTAAVTINENADPSVRGDIIAALDTAIPEESLYAHAEGNSPAHVKASLMGNSETILIKEGAPLLGRWQGIYFCEFDGPRRRRVVVNIAKE